MSVFFRIIDFSMSKTSLSNYIMLYQQDTVLEVYTGLIIQIWDFLWNFLASSVSGIRMHATQLFILVYRIIKRKCILIIKNTSIIKRE